MIDLNALYDGINIACYDGQLPDVPCYYFRNSAAVAALCGFPFALDGITIPVPETIPEEFRPLMPVQSGYFIGVCSGMSAIATRATLAHEIIHIWQMEKGYKANHGKRFHKEAFRVASILYPDLDLPFYYQMIGIS